MPKWWAQWSPFKLFLCCVYTIVSGATSLHCVYISQWSVWPPPVVRGRAAIVTEPGQCQSVVCWFYVLQ